MSDNSEQPPATAADIGTLNSAAVVDPDTDPEDSKAHNDTGDGPPGIIEVTDPNTYELDFNHCRLSKDRKSGIVDSN
jgi:hypothetical protein